MDFPEITDQHFRLDENIQLKPKFLNKRIMIGTPCYGGNVKYRYMESILRLQNFFAGKLEFVLRTITFDSLITRARNGICAYFLDEVDCDYLLFIDADIAFLPHTIVRLINYDQGVCGGVIPAKAYQWDKYQEAAKSSNTATEFQSKLLQFSINARKVTAPDSAGFIEADNIGTAFMLIKRETLLQLKQQIVDTNYISDIRTYTANQENYYTFFDTMVDPDSRRYLSEDYAFCYKWRNLCGGKVYADMFSEFTHFGEMPFRGNPRVIF